MLLFLVILALSTIGCAQTPEVAVDKPVKLGLIFPFSTAVILWSNGIYAFSTEISRYKPNLCELADQHNLSESVTRRKIV